MSMTHDEMIAVIAHHRDGGKVQCNNKALTGNWIDECHIASEGFDFASFVYRIKPEPLVLWAEIMPYGRHIQSSLYQFKPTNGGTIKKFIEEL